jgi:hypothetical protein
VDSDLDSPESADPNPRKVPQKGKIAEIKWFKKLVVL